ncbi:MAG: hypothetical protein E7069_00430 [Bacteroidales bacterium]|nr:hypothetical protein [Bacteroidales bacterium]
MHSKIQHNNSIRWQRWSRAKWAAFASVGRVVTIGVVSTSICYAAMRKNNVVSSSLCDFCNLYSTEYTHDDDSSTDDIQSLFINSVIEIMGVRSSSDIAAPASLYINTNNNNSLHVGNNSLICSEFSFCIYITKKQ